MNSPRHAQALAYARAQIPIFPCSVGAKTPATAHGFKDRTTDESRINAWWQAADYNIGLVPEDIECGVIDVDPKNGGDIAALGLPPTRTVITPSGGWHLYYYGSLPSTAGRLGPGLDTRGRSSYVLVPPSVVNGRPYIDSDAEIAEMPARISEALERAPVEIRQVESAAEFDTPLAIDSARAWLKGQPIVGEDTPSDDYPVFCRLKDWGLSADKMAEVLVERGAEDSDWLRKTASNAFKYGKNKPGSDIPKPHEAVFGEVVPPEPLIDAGFTRGSIITARYYAPKEWWWQDRVVARFPQLLTGAPKVGKTTFLLNLAVHILAQRPFLGQPTRCLGDVVLLCAEDDYGQLKHNLLAIIKEAGIDENVIQRLHLRSIVDEPVKAIGGHWLARIDDSGRTYTTQFAGEILMPFLAVLSNPLLLVDPLSEFVSFNRYSDAAARAMVTTWMAGLARAGATPFFTDHPGIAGMQMGRDVGGSVQMEASFSVVSTLKAGAWTGSVVRQREMTYATKFNRYAPEHEETFYRVAGSPAFVKDSAAPDRQTAVYRHVLEQFDNGQGTTQSNSGAYGPQAVAQFLGLTEKEVKEALNALLSRNWLKYFDTKGGGAQGHIGAHYGRFNGPKLSDLD